LVLAYDNQRNAPTFNIKAVARLTGVPADTLRRWESRYNVIAPERTDSGYRLYSQRDVDTILWLKSKLEEGLSISRACEMLRQLGGDPGRTHPVADGSAAPQAYDTRNEIRSFDALRDELLKAFVAVDEGMASDVLSDALSLYSVEDVCLRVVQPALIEVGEHWLSGKVSVAVEHFAASFVRARLDNLFHSSPHNPYGPLVVVGCAPGELHELGAMFLAVFLRRSGYRVVYLGQNVPLDSLIGMLRTLQPRAVCISATRADTAATLHSLREAIDAIQQEEGHAPLLAYGGQVFNRFPHISQRLGGMYLGEDARAAMRMLDEHLRVRS
jgi:MerR family transcriptional regulator, light-induced transcriptional regulator